MTMPENERCSKRQGTREGQRGVGGDKAFKALAQ